MNSGESRSLCMVAMREHDKARGRDLDFEAASKAALSACHSLWYLFSEPQQQDDFKQIEDGQDR